MSYIDQILNTSAPNAAKRLLGCLLVRQIDNEEIIGRIVETEAYDETDAASHSYRGQTERTKVMFGPPGFAYVYFTYGMHYCFNVVVGREGRGSAVLVRALEPVSGIEYMKINRNLQNERDLTNGPAKLCQALSINKNLYGHDLRLPPLSLRVNPAINSSMIIQTTRIGISREVHKNWRFYIANNPWVSKPVLMLQK